MSMHLLTLCMSDPQWWCLTTSLVLQSLPIPADFLRWKKERYVLNLLPKVRYPCRC